MPANLDGPALDTKRRAFFAYIDYDTMACGSPAACGTGQYGAWLGRQYRIDGEPPLIDNPPVATITAPGASLRWTAGQTIAFAGRAVDGEDGNLGASRLRWRVELVQPGAGPDGEDLAGPGQSYNGVASGTFVVPAWDRSPQQLRIELTATDSAANSTVEELRLDPAPPPTTTTTTTRPPTTTTTTRPSTTTTTTRPTTVVPPPANAAAPPLNPYARAFFEGIQRDREQRFWQAVARWVQYLRRSRLRRR